MIEQQTVFDPAPQNSGFTQPEKQSSGVWKYVTIGCIGFIILAIIGDFLVYKGIKGFMPGVPAKYTNEIPNGIA
jgi:hypothetical protein